MSGPKSYGYSIGQSAATEAELGEARDEMRSAQLEFEQVCREIDEAKARLGNDELEVHVGAPGVMAAAGDLASLRAHRNQLLQLASDARNALSAGIARLSLRRALAELAKGIDSSAPVVDHAPSTLPKHAPAGHAASEKARMAAARKTRGQLDRRLARLRTDVPETTRAEIRAIALQIAGDLASPRAELLLVEMALQIQEANKVAFKTREEVEEARRWLDELRPFPATEVQTVAAMFQDVVRGERRLDDRLRTRAAQARDDARRVADSAHAARVLRENLVRLGYEVDSDFATLFTDGGQALLQRPDQQGYSVRLLVNSSRSTLNFNVVRFSDGEDEATREQRIRDREVEESWCKDFEQLKRTLPEAGVDLRKLRALAPGECPVMVLKHASGESKQRKHQVGTSSAAPAPRSDRKPRS